MHHRLIPKRNRFVYKSYNLLMKVSELPKLNSWLIAYNKPRIFSVYNKDYGNHSVDPIQNWLQEMQQQFQLPIDDVYLMTMPRLLGYYFNPVSFWFFKNSKDELIAVIAEVNNTFGENHHYLICHPSLLPMTNTTYYFAKKIFHVSPFLPVAGHYEFRFHIPQFFKDKVEKIGVWITYFENDKKTLLTSITGKVTPLQTADLLRGLLRHFILPLKVVFLIHYQAVKLFLKRVPFYKKPPPPKQRLSK